MSGCGGFQWRLGNAATSVDVSTPLALRAADGVLYVAASDGLYAYKGGARSWAVTLPKGDRALAVGDGKIVVSGGNQVSAYDAADGKKLWEASFDKLSPPAIGEGKVAFLSNNLLVAVEAQTGAVSWKQAIAVDNALMRAVPFARVAPAISAGRVCAGLAWELNVVTLANGEKGAHEDATGGGVSASPVGDGKSCYFAQSRSEGGGFAAGSNTVHAVDPTAKKFAARWQHPVGDSDDDLGISNLLLDGGRLYVATNYRVAAFDKESGALLWTVKGAPIFPAPAHRGTRANRAGAFAFDAARGIITNDAPGTNFATGGGKLFLPSSYRDPQTKKSRDVVTALDAASGLYLGSFDAGGAEVRDLAVSEGTLWVATSGGLRAIKLDDFR
jgi:outer membrane protein assembly factor BamB